MNPSRLRPAGVVLMAVVLLSGSLSLTRAQSREVSEPGYFARHDFHSSAADVRGFWTRARMRSAPPISEAGVLTESETDGWSTSVRSQQMLALRSALLQDAPYKRREIADPSAYPYRVHGKLFVRAGRLEYHCSATAVQSANESVVFTAGHCLYSDDIGGWVDSAAFVPGYEYGDRPYGTWIAQSAFATPVWVKEETARADIGALVMEPLGGASLVDAVGGRAIAFDQGRQQRFEAFGYPAAGGFDGERLYVCVADSFGRDASPEGTGPDPTGIGCDMTQGASGGGWVIDGKALNSINSYGYQNGDGDDLPYMFGPYFGSMAQVLYTQAESVPVDLPTPSPSVSVTPSELPSASPSPTPTLIGRMQTVSDSKDSRGPFDISSVTVIDEAGVITINLTTYDDWGPRLLSPKHPRNRFFVDFDTVGGDAEDYYLGVFSRDGRLVGRIYAYAPGRDPVIGRATVTRMTRNDFAAAVSGDVLQLESKLRWYASSFFKTRNRCQTGCRDFAPNRTMVEM